MTAAARRKPAAPFDWRDLFASDAEAEAFAALHTFRTDRALTRYLASHLQAVLANFNPDEVLP